jgi:hypothetical protein
MKYLEGECATIQRATSLKKERIDKNITESTDSTIPALA